MRAFVRTAVALVLVLGTGVPLGAVASELGSAAVAEPAAPRTVPAQIAFQGLLIDDTTFPPTPFDGTVDLEARLWDAATGGTTLWGPESHVNVVVNNGVFQIALGSGLALPVPIFDGSDLFLGIAVNGEPELPRTQLLASPFAIRAQEADHALVADTAVIADDGDWTQSGGDVYRATGNVGIGTTTPQSELDVAGRVTTEVLEITGGADLAEPFEMAPAEEALPAGSVVVIDTETPGRLRQSTRPYDTRVAGVISGAGGVRPGLKLSQQGRFESGRDVALSGRVYVRATASNGPIHPGDLLTTSDTPGHAMKATDRDRVSGSVLGKAMSSLDRGTGLVLVLVALQ